jgi:hypothetical protein
MQISGLIFREQFKLFQEAVRLDSEEEFRSFREGLPKKWEGYKEDVYTEGRRRLAWSIWKDTDVNSGSRILKRVINAIEIAAAPGVKPNNLVDWDNRYGPARRVHRKLLAALQNKIDANEFARVFYGLYRNNLSESDAFETLKNLAGGRYDLLAYLFFLKDWDRFMPIAPTTFDKAFELLGINLITSRRCSWENYTEFNAAILAVQTALKDIGGVNEARLIDAHSFCWILVRLKPPTPTTSVSIPLPQPLSLLSAVPQIDQTASVPTDDEYAIVDDDSYAKRDEQRRRLGRLAQEIALESERKRLRAANRPDLAENVKDVSNQPARGYDILSFETNGNARYIEVKVARRSGNNISFFLSENEWQKSGELSNYYFYLVFGARGQNPDVEFLEANQVSSAYLKAIDYSVAFTTDSSTRAVRGF